MQYLFKNYKYNIYKTTSYNLIDIWFEDIGED
jgi:hypothetical protein